MSPDSDGFLGPGGKDGKRVVTLTFVLGHSLSCADTISEGSFTTHEAGHRFAQMEWVDWHSARAALEWQVDLGVTEVIGETPVDRYALEVQARAAKAASNAVPQPVSEVKSQDRPAIPKQALPDPVAQALELAARADSLEALAAAQSGFEHCDLKKGARNFVFADGVAGAPVMIIGDAPGRDEDQQGKPFAGRAGHLLDKMLAAVDMSRTRDVYICNVLPWRPQQNSDPKPAELAMMMPFMRRHIALAAPKVLIAMGNQACGALLGRKGITRLRGQWDEAEGLPVLPMLHPDYLLRQPHAKRQAWEDLLALKGKIRAL